MHICLVTQEYPPETGWGGIGAYSFDLAKGLKDLGHQVSIVTLAGEDGEKEVDSNGISVYRIKPEPDWSRWPGLWRLNHIWPGFAWAARRKVMDLHQKNPIDIIESPENRADSYLIKPFCPGPRYVVRLHTASRFVDEINHKKPDLRWRLTYLQEGWVLRHADCITAPSEAVVALTRSVFRLPDRISVIPNPVDCALFHPGSIPKRVELLFVGRLEEHKGIKMLARLAPQLLSAVPELHIRIAGQDTLDRQGRSWKKVFLSGIDPSERDRINIAPVPRHDLPELYARAAVVVVPSLWESFSYVVVESMACGTPVVASDVGGISNLVDEGQTGYLVPPDREDLFRDRLLDLLRDLEKAMKMGKKARDKVEKNYSVKKVIPQMLKTYQDLIQNE